MNDPPANDPPAVRIDPLPPATPTVSVTPLSTLNVPVVPLKLWFVEYLLVRLIELVFAVTRNVPPLNMTKLLVFARLFSLPDAIVPALIVTTPVNSRLSPLSVSVPAPTFVRPHVPTPF